MSRFEVGDVVVLNEHRLTVEGVVGADSVVLLSAPGRAWYRVPTEWLPDPEPRVTPQITAARDALIEALAALDRYEQEHGQREDGWECFAPYRAVLRDRLAHLDATPRPAATP